MPEPKYNDQAPVKIKSIADYLPKLAVKKSTIHTEKHAIIAELRQEYGDTAKSGAGSFGWYLGLLRGMENDIVYRLRSEVRQSDVTSKAKVFAWKVRDYKKKQKEKLKT